MSKRIIEMMLERRLHAAWLQQENYYISDNRTYGLNGLHIHHLLPIIAQLK
jgi:hypothetical protein